MSKFKIELFCFVKKIKWRAWAAPLKRDIYRLDFICNIFLSRDFLPIYNLEIAVRSRGRGEEDRGFCPSAWKEPLIALQTTHHSQTYLPSVLTQDRGTDAPFKTRIFIGTHHWRCLTLISHGFSITLMCGLAQMSPLGMGICSSGQPHCPIVPLAHALCAILSAGALLRAISITLSLSGINPRVTELLAGFRDPLREKLFKDI